MPQPDRMLIEPSLSKIASLVNQGALTPADTAKPITTTWQSRLPSELLPFVKSLDLGQLAVALTAQPGLLWHPLVQRQLLHLGKLRADDRWLEPGQQTGAGAYFRTLVAAFVEGALGEGWSLKPPPGRPGRPKSVEALADAFVQRSQFEELLRLLRDVDGAIAVEVGPRRRRRGESDAVWTDRLHRFIQCAWQRSSLSREPTSPEPARSNGSLTLKDLFDRSITWKTVSLPASASRKIEEQAARRRTIEPSVIAYALLAQHWRTTPTKVKWAVQLARQRD